MTKDDLVSKDTALRMAIETLELLNEHVYRTGNAYDAIKACKKALERPSNMVAVPLDKLEDMQRRLKALEQPAQEPVGKVYNGNAYWAGKAPDNATPLYTHPTQPLSDDEIEDIGYNFADLGGDIADWSGFARAIEKAHNIGERNAI
jgi:hypothetical protein